MSGLNDGRLIDFDPVTGVQEDYYEIDGKWYLKQTQDVSNILELNKAEFNNVDERARFKHETMNHVARLPLVVLEDLRKRGILDDKKAFLKWLSDADNAAFRTRPGKLT